MSYFVFELKFLVIFEKKNHLYITHINQTDEIQVHYNLNQNNANHREILL